MRTRAYSRAEFGLRCRQSVAHDSVFCVAACQYRSSHSVVDETVRKRIERVFVTCLFGMFSQCSTLPVSSDCSLGPFSSPLIRVKAVSPHAHDYHC